MTKDNPECVIPVAWIGCDVTVGWKIAIPQMKPPHREIKIKIGDMELEAMRPERVSSGVCKDDTDKPINAPKPVNELAPTAAMMCSEDYKERFKAEYYQTKIRSDKLHKMCVKYEAGTLDFTPTCSLELLTKQAAAMGNYLKCLEIRAQIEGVTL